MTFQNRQTFLMNIKKILHLVDLAAKLTPKIGQRVIFNFYLQKVCPKDTCWIINI